jgi:hypothetical protein
MVITIKTINQAFFEKYLELPGNILFILFFSKNIITDSLGGDQEPAGHGLSNARSGRRHQHVA